MEQSLDDYIQGGKQQNSRGDMSLDEYIHMRKINKPPQYNRSRCEQSDSGLSKFDRYKHQDDDEDDMDEDGLPTEMPKLVPFKAEPGMPKKPIHQRLGKRDSVCESIHTSQLQLYKPNGFKAKNRGSVQNRLGKNWVSPAEKERNRIAMHALQTFAKSAARNMLCNDSVNGQTLFKAFTKAIEDQVQPAPKYNMKVQKEICQLQGKDLYYTCPGACVVSNDGPGLRGLTKVPSHSTDISLNQRFA